MKKEYCIITTSTNNKEVAEKITKELLELKLVSYVQESKRFSSYWWKNEIVQEDEYILTMGSKKILFPEIKKVIKSIHNYEVPAIVMYDIVDANEEILNWLEDEVKIQD